MTSDEKPQNAYEIVLADLRAKRDQIDQAIAAIEALSGVTTASVGARAAEVAPAVVQAGMFLGSTIADAARRVLEIHKRTLSTREILDDIVRGGVHLTSATPLNTVQTVLGRQPDIVKVKRGVWGLSAWYPSSGRFKRPRVRLDDTDLSETESDLSEVKGEDESSANFEATPSIEQSPSLKVVS